MPVACRTIPSSCLIPNSLSCLSRCAEAKKVWPLYSKTLDESIGIHEQYDQYVFYGVTLTSAWQAVKHVRSANWIVQYLEAVKGKDIEGRHHYATLLRQLDGPVLEAQLRDHLKRTKASVFGFGVLTVVSFIAERKGMLTRFFKRGTSSGAAPSKHA